MLPRIEQFRFVRRVAYSSLIFLLALSGFCSGQQMQVTLNPAQTKIAWTLGGTMHDVHGTFTLKSGAVKFDPRSGDASGGIIVDATSGESGNPRPRCRYA